jgi:hypothetical protein
MPLLRALDLLFFIRALVPFRPARPDDEDIAGFKCHPLFGGYSLDVLDCDFVASGGGVGDVVSGRV